MAVAEGFAALRLRGTYDLQVAAFVGGDLSLLVGGHRSLCAYDRATLAELCIDRGDKPSAIVVTDYLGEVNKPMNRAMEGRR